jgi:hypothetical protein
MAASGTEIQGKSVPPSLNASTVAATLNISNVAPA